MPVLRALLGCLSYAPPVFSGGRWEKEACLWLERGLDNPEI